MLHNHVKGSDGIDLGHWGISNDCFEGKVLFQICNYADTHEIRHKLGMDEAALWLHMFYRALDGHDGKVERASIFRITPGSWKLTLRQNERPQLNLSVSLTINRKELLDIIDQFQAKLAKAGRAMLANQISIRD